MSISCSSDPAITETSLEYIGSFSGDGVGFIGRARSIYSDENNIYVGDTGKAEVKVYTKEGKFQFSFGRSGRGPGEFSGLLQLSEMGDELIIHDLNQQKVHIYTKSGDYVNSFLLENRHSTPFYFYEDRLTAGKAAIAFESSNDSYEPFDVFSLDGKYLTSFGKEPYSDMKLPGLLRRFNAEIEGQELRVFFTFLGVYQVYDIESGDLISQVNLEEIVSPIRFNDITSSMLKQDGVLIEGKNELIGYNMESSGDQLFLYTDVGDSISIHQLMTDGDQVKYLDGYSYPKSGERTIYGILDMEYDPEAGSFYILENESLNGFIVSKYLPKN